MTAPRPSALARLEAAVGLVDDVGAAPAADHAAVAMARLEGLERVADLHGLKRLPAYCDEFAENARRSPSGRACPSQAGADAPLEQIMLPTCRIFRPLGRSSQFGHDGVMDRTD